MLFRKKDSNDGDKAKNSFFASKAKKDDAVERDDERKALALSQQGAADVDPKKPGKKIKATVAAGKVNADILRRPRITEKSTNESMKNVYTFDVSTSSNKREIKEAVRDVYGVTPVAVRVVAVPSKRVVSRRGIRGVKSGGKKAYVELKKGDTIELV